MSEGKNTSTGQASTSHETAQDNGEDDTLSGFGFVLQVLSIIIIILTIPITIFFCIKVITQLQHGFFIQPICTNIFIPAFHPEDYTSEEDRPTGTYPQQKRYFNSYHSFAIA